MKMNNLAHSLPLSLDKAQIADWFYNLQNQICSLFEKIENEHEHLQISKDPGIFQKKSWDRPGGGGGEMRLMKGRIFEKVGVNVSVVEGPIPEFLQINLPNSANAKTFWAAGISLVAHMWSPHVPPIHFNTRCIETSHHWFGGGMDMSPAFPDDNQTKAFHATLKKMCDRFSPEYYERFKLWCDEYFYLKHRQEPRGIGGIFFDYLDSGNWHHDFDFVVAAGTCFRDHCNQYIRDCASKTWTPQEREALLIKRGRYAEFNLLYDRGTQFGLHTNGNTEAILMSLPPEAIWP